MPPKVELSTLIAKRDSTIVSLNELFEEFYMLYQVEPLLSTLENVYKEVESKYRSVKRQQETITDRLNASAPGELQTKNQEIGDEAKANFLKCTEQFAIYQKSFAAEKPPFKHEALEAMTSAVTKMADVFEFAKERKPWIKEIVCSHVGWI